VVACRYILKFFEYYLPDWISVGFDSEFGVVVTTVVFTKYLADVFTAAPSSYSSGLLIITLVSNKKYFIFYN